MRFAAILKKSGVGAGFSISSRGDREVLFGVALAAGHKEHDGYLHGMGHYR